MRGYTVEMSFLMPMILLLIMSSILGVFYYHDKNIIAGAAYETAVVGAVKARERDGVDTRELEKLFEERVGDKCILFDGAQVTASAGDDEIEILARGERRGMSISVLKRMPVTDPERKIRDYCSYRTLQVTGNGVNSNNQRH